MINEHQLAIDAGLVDGGIDGEGNQQYIGTKKQWKRFEDFKEMAMREEELDQANINGYYDKK